MWRPAPAIVLNNAHKTNNSNQDTPQNNTESNSHPINSNTENSSELQLSIEGSYRDIQTNNARTSISLSFLFIFLVQSIKYN